MSVSMSRRGFLGLVPALPLTVSGQAPGASPVPSSFPQQEADLVREIVTVAHGNLARVKELSLIHI